MFSERDSPQCEFRVNIPQIVDTCGSDSLHVHIFGASQMKNGSQMVTAIFVAREILSVNGPILPDLSQCSRQRDWR